MIAPEQITCPGLEGGSVPLFRQIYERIAQAVLDGRLAPGARLPSARSLAAQLAVARGTVDAAYQMLAGEGYLMPRGAAGTVVAPGLADGHRETAPCRRPETFCPPAPGAEEATGRIPLFRMGLPALDAFPDSLWSRLVARQARLAPAGGLDRPAAAGLEALRVQVARYLAVARGVACSPEQVFITAGYRGALGLIARCLLQPGDPVWVEDPGYHLGRDGLRLAGARPVGVPVDGEGFNLGHALAQASPARMAVVTPTHQFPLGMTLSLPRRMALLDWAAATGGWIVEDDYDSEFRYRGRPLPALKSLDRHGRVLFAGTFGKVLLPSLQTGYLVVPPGLEGRFAEAAALLHPPPPVLVQAGIAAFMERGHLARHIRRMRELYRQRRAALAEALQQAAGELLAIDLQAGGMHLVARLRAGSDDTRLAARLGRLGMAPMPLSACAVDASCGPGLLINFTNVDREQAADAAQRLAAALAA